MKKNSLYDKKSLKEITGKSADWNEVAKDCVAFSNAQGGIIDYGIEDDAEEPMPNQQVPEELVVTLQNKINGRTSNVNAYGEILTHSLKNSEYKGTTSLKRIENYRIRELIIEDLKIYKSASLKDIHERIGKEIPSKKIWAQLKYLIDQGVVEMVGVNRWSKYQLIEDSSLFQNRE